ncbi:MAG TPA: phosphatidylglycerophosphatase A [Methylomirabilota bacterium]|nr:phosphatidylglycerophosphatase A [Methylomirabilota bacterium]
MALVVASVCGAGYSPVASGTVGSLAAAIALWLIPFTRVSLVATTVAVTVIGTWAAWRVERATGRKDPGLIVIDEVAGMFLSVLLLPRTLSVLATAFLLFRALDIWKPFPCREAQALAGGLGVMLDDVIAGVYALILILGSRMLFGLPA